jgi:hypothetical protein
MLEAADEEEIVSHGYKYFFWKSPLLKIHSMPNLVWKMWRGLHLEEEGIPLGHPFSN